MEIFSKKYLQKVQYSVILFALEAGVELGVSGR